MIHLAAIKARIKRSIKRMIKAMLRPAYNRMGRPLARIHALEQHVARQTEAAEKAQRVIAHGWDYLALSRRLAVLEDRVEELTQMLETQPAAEHVRPASPPHGTRTDQAPTHDRELRSIAG